jgi:hypothetical protein
LYFKSNTNRYKLTGVHYKLSQGIKGLPTLVKGLLSCIEHFKGWQPLRQFEIQPLTSIMISLFKKTDLYSKIIK